MSAIPARTAAEWIAEFVVARGVDRVYGLQGGHIQPIWDHLAQRKVRIVDVRDEGAAVHMAHCHAVLTGQVGIALVTAGPGVTNCVTAIANAQLERAPVLLIGGCAPIPQDDLGPLQGIDHVSIMKPVTRSARTLRTADNLLRDLDKAWSTAMGDGNPPGPVYVEIPTDVLRMRVPPGIVLPEYLAPKAPRRIPPEPQHVARAAALIACGAPAARPHRPRRDGQCGGAHALSRCERRTVSRHAGEPRPRARNAPVVRRRGARPCHEGSRPSRRDRSQARLPDRLRLAGVFPNARWIRIADNAEELRENRRGEAELFAHPGLALEAMTASLPARGAVDTAWTKSMRDEHLRRSAKYADELARAPAGNDGHMHPNRIFAALRKVLAPDAITIADGGDILSFARLGLDAPRTYLDAGTFGCLGVGTPFGVAAALLHPGRQVVVVSGDGAFGINAMEIDSAKRHGAKAVFIIANNAAWNIERLDQQMNYGGRVVGTTLAWSDYAGMARAFGLHAERVTDPDRLEGALREAFTKAPALLDVVVTQDALSSDAGKGLGWVPDFQALTAWDDAEKERRR